MSRNCNDDQAPWYNQHKTPLYYQQDVTPRNIYFLYGFLGDGFQIRQPNFQKNLDLWQQTNPNWNLQVLRRHYDQLDKVVKENFPKFWLMYRNYPKPIQQCDIIRYMLMYQYGGVYTDLDVIPNVDINSVLSKYPHANVIFGIARVKPQNKCRLAQRQESIRRGEPEIPVRLANYFFIARIPYHPIWMDILNLAKQRCNRPIQSQYGIIYTTGPDVVTTAINQHRSKYRDIEIVPMEIFTKSFRHTCTSFATGNKQTSWRSGLPAGEKSQGVT
jgi:mannosyltransferase OCH1-like enzyme